MTKLVACAEASRLDSSTGAAVPPLLLMEDASLLMWEALATIARSRGAGESKLLLAICGSGNNGGDALALIRHAVFSGLTRVAAILASKPGELTAIHAASLKALGVELVSWADDRAACERLLSQSSLIVDGLSGTGLSGPLREPLASLLAAANAQAAANGAAIVSLDLPSGLSDSLEPAWPLVDAAWTLSVEPRKACLYYPAARGNCGEIIPIEGVFPCNAQVDSDFHLLDEEDLRSLAPLPPDSAYKGTRGGVAVFAGSVGAGGAAVLSSRACLAAGAGIVALFASQELLPLVAPMLDAVMAKLEPEDIRSFDAARYDALLIGPGWGKEGKRPSQLAALLETGLPAVLDADAISLYRDLVASGFRARGPIILTPHPGEFALLTGGDAARALASPPEPLARAAKAMNAVIILKSHVTWICSPAAASEYGEMAVWDGLESGLGTAGSGDVLAGLAAGLLARAAAAATAGAAELSADSAFTAARAAVIAHGVAGRRARRERGWFESSAIIEEAAKLLGIRDPIHP